VLLPFRDAADTLNDCLESILAQSFAEFELLAVDDGSRDGSADLVRGVAARDPRVRLLRSGGDGLVAALNTGMRAARSPLLARMDADDRMLPVRLAAQERFLAANPQVAVVGSRVQHAAGTPPSDGLSEYLRWLNGCLSSDDIAEEIYVESPLAHPSVMMRRDRIVDAGGYRSGPFPEDYDLWLRLVHDGQRLAKLPQVLLHWRDRPGRLSRTDPRYGRDAFDRLRAEYLSRDGRLQSERPLVIWGAGRRTRRRAALLLAHGHRPRAWIDIDPRKIGNRIDGVPVLPPRALRVDERPFVLGYVASHGARELIADALGKMGYERGRDYLMVG